MDAYIDNATVWTNDPPGNCRIIRPLLGPWVTPQLKQWTTCVNTKSERYFQQGDNGWLKAHIKSKHRHHWTLHALTE